MELIACTHPDKLHGILLTSDAFDPTENDLIDDVIIKYSVSGSNNRKKEEEIILFWSEFITSCANDGQYFAHSINVYTRTIHSVYVDIINIISLNCLCFRSLQHFLV